MRQDEIVSCIVISERALGGRWPEGAPCPANPGKECSCYLDVDTIADRRCTLWQCAQCRRRLPECFGASDDQPEVCDDCW